MRTLLASALTGADAERQNKMPDLAELRELLKQCLEIRDELWRLDKMEADARCELKKIVQAGGLDGEKSQRDTAEAQVRLGLVQERRRILRAPDRKTALAIRDRYLSQSRQWNELVAGARRKESEAVIAAMLPFFEGDERKCRRAFDHETLERLPSFHKYRRAEHASPFPCAEPEKLDFVQLVESLIAHIERQGKNLGWV